MSKQRSEVQRLTAVTAYLKSKQLLLSVFLQQYVIRVATPPLAEYFAQRKNTK